MELTPKESGYLLHSVVADVPIWWVFFLPDYRQVTGQGSAAGFLVPAPARGGASGTGVPEMAHRFRGFPTLDARVPAARGVWPARVQHREASGPHLRSVRPIAALHRTTDRAHHAHRLARVGKQMPQPEPHAAGLLNRHAAS